MRRWNQTGQKYAGSADIGRTFMKEHNYCLWILVAATYAYMTIRVAKRGHVSSYTFVSWPYAGILGILAIAFRVDFTRADSPELLAGIEDLLLLLKLPLGLVMQARLVFILLGLGIVACSIVHRRDLSGNARHARDYLPSIRSFLAIFLATQSRVSNVPQLAIFEALFVFLGDGRRSGWQKASTIEVALLAIVFQYASFFAFGGTNAIGSVDLSNAYNGVSGYNVIAVGLLTFVSNWIGPVWWAVAATEILASLPNRKRTFNKYALAMTFFVSCSLVATMIACTLLRTHLFIWTVFSPKYLVSMAWSLGQHLLVNLGLTSVLLWTLNGEDTGAHMMPIKPSTS